MSLHFQEHARKGEEFIKEIAAELGTEDIDRAGRVFRSVIRALRSRMTIEESFQLIAQLPMAIKSVYVEGMKVNLHPAHFNHIEQFREQVIREDDWAALKDYYYDGAVEEAIYAVFKVLSRHVSAGEMSKVLEVLPAEIRLLFQD